MKRILVERSPREGGDWVQVGPTITPADLRGSGTAIRDSQEVVVAFGWDDEGVPRVWQDNHEPEKLPGQRAHRLPVEQLVPLADLRDGPFELDGPINRWRWSLIDD